MQLLIGTEANFPKQYGIYPLFCRKGIFLILLYFVFSNGIAYSASLRPAAEENQRYKISNIGTITASDRILVLTPHPDDEAVSCAGIIQEALRAGADVNVLYLTNGDNNEFAFIVYEKRLTFRKGVFLHLGEVRRQEAINAMKLLGLQKKNLIFLGYPDFGTFSIFRYFWQANKPFKSMLTRVSRVPYKTSLSFGAAYDGENILRDLKNILQRHKPNKIFVSHPIDINADHKTMYLFLEIALADLNKDLPRPEIYAYLIHFKGWPLPRRYASGLALLPPKEFNGSKIRWFQYELSPQVLEKKRKAIFCYKSQTPSSATYLLSFVRKNELFGVYPELNLDYAASGLKHPKGSQALAKKRIRLPFGLYKIFPDSQPVKKHCSVNYEVENGSFLIHIDRQAGIKNRIGKIIYLFGYSYKTPFRQMPKIRIIAKYKSIKIFNGRKPLKQGNVILDLQPQEDVLKIPLVLLGDPDFLFVSVKGYANINCVDTLSFRKVNIRR